MAQRYEGEGTKLHHVLVVDADASSRAAIEDALRGTPVRVWGAASGHVALEGIPGEVPEAVLLDADAPLPEEQAFAAALHTRFRRPIPVILLASPAQGPQLAAAIGAEKWLQKPLSLDNLYQEIAQFLDDER